MQKIRRASGKPTKPADPANPPKKRTGNMPPEPPADTITSIVFAALLVLAMIIGASTWLGGGIPKANSYFSNALDSTARFLGFSVSSIQISGLDAAPSLKELVRATARLEPGENMWRATPHRIRSDIEAMGQVTNIRVARYWPDHIVIYADPIIPIAVHSQNDMQNLVDKAGKVYAIGTEFTGRDLTDLPQFTGEGAAIHIPNLTMAIQNTNIQMAQAEWYRNRRWILRTHSGLALHLPAGNNTEDLQRSLERAEALIAMPWVKSARLLDLRVPDRAVIGGRNITINSVHHHNTKNSHEVRHG